MSIRDIFNEMSYGPAPESAAEALSWINAHGARFGHWIDGAFTKPGESFATSNPATGQVLAEVTQGTAKDIEAAVAAARRAQPKWARLSAHQRARHLYALARLVQKHARLLAVLETLDNGKPIRESRDIDIPLVARHFYYHAGLAQLLPAELPDMAPVGVCGAVIPWNFPLLMLAWKVAPALAAGNTVVLKPAEYTPLTALLFAELSREAGLPRGVLNIVTGDGATGAALVDHPGVDKIAFTGSTSVGRKIREATAGSGKALTLELGGKSPYIVFDDADLDSAIEGLVDAIWFNQGQVCCAGSRLLVQEGVAERFHTRLKRRMDGLRIGDPLDKCIDVGAVVDPIQLATIRKLVDETPEGEIYRADTPVPAGCFYPPTLITGLSAASTLMQEEIFGPVLVSMTFRTPEEAVALANNTRYGLAATVWTENVNLALDIAPKLKAGVVWVNATNLFDAAAGFGGIRESGFGREGGWEGLLAYLKPAAAAKPLKPVAAVPAPRDPEVPDLDRTAKLYVGGKQARPDGGYSRAVWSPRASFSAMSRWATARTSATPSKPPMPRRDGPVPPGIPARRSSTILPRTLGAVGRVRTAAARPDRAVGRGRGGGDDRAPLHLCRLGRQVRRSGQVGADPGCGAGDERACGVVGALCPDESPLLGLVSVMAPAIAMGNTCVLVPSAPFPWPQPISTRCSTRRTCRAGWSTSSRAITPNWRSPWPGISTSMRSGAFPPPISRS